MPGSASGVKRVKLRVRKSYQEEEELEFAPQTSQNCRDGTVTRWDQWTAIWRQSSESEALAEVGCGEKQEGQLATP